MSRRPPSPTGSDYDDDQPDESSVSSTPPLPPPFSPEDEPSYEALERQSKGDGSTDAAPLLDDCFPRPPPRDLAASAMIAANSALGATSPLVRERLGA